MPKLKTHRGAAKRFKKTASGKFKRAKAFKSHILTKKAPGRKRKSESSWSETLPEPVSAEPHIEDRLRKRQEVALLQRAMAALPAEKREVLVLSRYQEMKYEQIAELLGCEVGTVKVRVHRAMRELREVFFKLSGEKASWNAKKSETSLRII